MIFIDDESSASQQPPSKKLKLSKNLYFELYQATNYKPDMSVEEIELAQEALKNPIDQCDLESLFVSWLTKK